MRKRPKKIRLKIQRIIVFLVIIIPIFLFHFLYPRWAKETPEELTDVLGIGIILFGFLFRIAARGYKAEIHSNNKGLSIGGPYGLIRHPMYLGTLLIGSGIILTLFKWWIFPTMLIVFLLIYIPQIRREEGRLFKRFGKDYQTYCQSVPKYFPNIFAWFKIGLRDYLFFKRTWVKKEIPSLIGVICVITAFEIWQDVKLFGCSEYHGELLEFSLIIAFFVIIFTLYFYKKKNISTNIRTKLQ